MTSADSAKHARTALACTVFVSMHTMELEVSSLIRSSTYIQLGRERCHSVSFARGFLQSRGTLNPSDRDLMPIDLRLSAVGSVSHPQHHIQSGDREKNTAAAFCKACATLAHKLAGAKSSALRIPAL